jgi:hypothetical protein
MGRGQKKKKNRQKKKLPFHHLLSAQRFRGRKYGQSIDFFTSQNIINTKENRARSNRRTSVDIVC